MFARTAVLALVVSTAFVAVAPNAAATHVPICGQIAFVDFVEGDPVCFVDCTWDSITMARFKYILGCLRHITG